MQRAGIWSNVTLRVRAATVITLFAVAAPVRLTIIFGIARLCTEQPVGLVAEELLPAWCARSIVEPADSHAPDRRSARWKEDGP
jgi:hypothetical protein